MCSKIPPAHSIRVLKTRQGSEKLFSMNTAGHCPSACTQQGAQKKNNNIKFLQLTAGYSKPVRLLKKPFSMYTAGQCPFNMYTAGCSKSLQLTAGYSGY